MGLSLNNIYQRPYVNQDRKTPLKRKTEDEQTESTQANRQQQSNQDSRSKGLQYIEQQVPRYSSNTETKFSIPAQNAYAGVNINSPRVETTVSQAVNQPASISTIENKINIAQILKDFKNTSLAIGTPDDLGGIVSDYLSLVEKQVKTGNANPKIVKSTLNNAASILDNYISETLNKNSKVVENWVDALFLQNIDLNYDDESVNERFLVKFPEGAANKTSRNEDLNEIDNSNSNIQTDSENSNVIPITVVGETTVSKIPQDKELKSLFIQAKKYVYSNKPEEAIATFEKALNRSLDVDDTETTGKIYYEVGKIYDNHDYVAQALKSYNQSLKLSTDENIKTKAHYSMAQIYDDVNQVDSAIDHYMSTVSHAGEADNLPAQSTSLTKIGNIYSDMYDKEAFDYYDMAGVIANETDNSKLKGYVSSNTGNAHVKFQEPDKALKSYSKAVQNYTDAAAPRQTAQNYVAAADLMVEYSSLHKAKNLLTKAQKYARQTEDVNLMNDINEKLNSLDAMMQSA